MEQLIEEQLIEKDIFPVCMNMNARGDSITYYKGKDIEVHVKNNSGSVELSSRKEGEECWKWTWIRKKEDVSKFLKELN